MMFKVSFNETNTEATITYKDGKTFKLYDSEGNVQNLVLFFTLPSVPKDVKLEEIETVYQSSIEDTQPCLKVA